MEMLSDMGSIPIISTIVSTIWAMTVAQIVDIYYQILRPILLMRLKRNWGFDRCIG